MKKIRANNMLRVHYKFSQKPPFPKEEFIELKLMLPFRKWGLQYSAKPKNCNAPMLIT
jgi:hypothetical protein